MTPAAREYLAAYRASEKASKARAALPAGSSRARVTTVNARWSSAAEHRDRLEAALTPADLAEVRARLALEAR
jgi:hypothetical protein